MVFDSKKHHRRSIRVPEYNYAAPGAYYITICSHEMKTIFGKIKDDNMLLNQIGDTIAACWQDIPRHFPNVEIDQSIIMPNHFHGILWITTEKESTAKERFAKPQSGSLATIVRSFKAAVTKQVNRLRNTPGATVWQRNYYERIIRDEDELNRFRQYILDNPVRWESDSDNNERSGLGMPSPYHG